MDTNGHELLTTKQTKQTKMPRRRAVNPLKDLSEQNEFRMLKIQRLRRLGGCHRCTAAKDLMRKLVTKEKFFAKKQENEL